MKRFTLFSLKRNTLALLLFYVLLAFVIMNFNDGWALRSMRVGVLQVISWGARVQTAVKHLKNLSEENKRLKAQNLRLSINNLLLQEAVLENIRLRRLLSLKKRSEFRFVSATVIGKGQEQTINSLILDVGRQEGVRKNLPVVTSQGLVGKVIHVTSHRSIAQILMDRNSLVSARLQRSREVGVISWSGDPLLDLLYIPREVPVLKGEVVLTSGLSKIYPKGLKIGIVAEVKEDNYGLFKKIKVKPAVDFNRLEEVFVLLRSDSLETKETNSE